MSPQSAEEMAIGVDERDDDGFGPVLRGRDDGDDGRAGAEGPARARGDDGFGPPLRGSGRGGGGARAGGSVAAPRGPLSRGSNDVPPRSPRRSPGSHGSHGSRAAQCQPAPQSSPTPQGPRGGDGFGPSHRGRAPRTRRAARSLAKGGLSGLLILALVAVAVSGALLLTALVSLERQPVDGLAGGLGQMNVLVVGSDSREGLSPEELQALGTEAVEGRRTDTIFVLSIRGGAAAMLSFPRDLFVTQCDGSRGRINAAFAAGGASCLVETVAQTSGIPVTHYAEVNLGGFVRIVDAVDGVSLYLDAPLRDVAAGVDLPAGCVHLDGREAIGFVRARSVDSDLGRIARQQRFLSELLKDVVSVRTLVDVPRLFRVTNAAASSLVVDDDLGVLDLARMARAARGLAGGGLATYTVPASPQTIGGAAVLVPEEAGAAALYEQFSSGAVLDIPPAAEVAALSPGDVQLAVRNGTDTSGLATQVAQALEARGFEVTDVGNAEAVEQTVVRHGPGLAAAAQVVAGVVPGAATAVDDSLDSIELVLGPGAEVAAEPAPGPQAEAPSADTPLGAGAVPEDC